MYDQTITPARPSRLDTTREGAWEKLLLEIVDAVSVPASEYDRIESHYRAISEILADPNDPQLADGHVFPQGSFLARTVIRALGDGEIDVDAIVLLPETTLTPRELLDCVHRELDARARTQGKIERRNRCVTVHYADDTLPAHLDVTPAVPSIGNEDDEGWGPLEVPDYERAEWHPTNPKDFADWFNDVSDRLIVLDHETVAFAEDKRRASTEPLPSHQAVNAFDPLRAAIKLMKRHRDVFRDQQPSGSPVPISVVITTLAAKAYLEVAQLSQHRPMTALQAIREIVNRMPSQFDQDGRMGGAWVLSNPRRPQENFAEKWNRDPTYAAMFSRWHSELQSAVGLGFAEFSEQRLFEDAVLSAFGPEARGRTRTFLLDEAKRKHAIPGMSASAADQLHKAGAVNAVFSGLAASEPNEAAAPRSLGRLG